MREMPHVGLFVAQQLQIVSAKSSAHLPCTYGGQYTSSENREPFHRSSKGGVMTNKKKTVLAVILMAMIVSMFSAAQAEIPREKSEPLANVLKSSFRERDYDQSSYKSNKAAIRPDEQQARAELKGIHIEIGDGLAGKGKLVKIEEI